MNKDPRANSEPQAPSDAPQGPQTHSEGVSIHTALREALEILELPAEKDYLSEMDPRALTPPYFSGSFDPLVPEQAAGLFASLFRSRWTHAHGEPEGAPTLLPAAEARAVIAWSSEVFRSVQRAAEAGPPSAALELWRDTLGLPRPLAELPLFGSSRSKAPARGSKAPARAETEFESFSSFLGKPFNIIEKAGRLTMKDFLLTGEIANALPREPPLFRDRVVFSLAKGTDWANYGGDGGEQHKLVKQSLARLKGVAFKHEGRGKNGGLTTVGWGIIDNYIIHEAKDGGEARVEVTVNEVFARQVRDRELDFLNRPMLRALEKEDDLAARLWAFLEQQQLPWNFLLFSAREGEPEVMRDTPAIADVLGISWWKSRPAVKQRIKEACQALTRGDPRYRLTITSATGKGMWKLQASKRKGPPLLSAPVDRSLEPEPPPVENSLEQGVSTDATLYYGIRDPQGTPAKQPRSRNHLPS